LASKGGHLLRDHSARHGGMECPAGDADGARGIGRVGTAR
jgi:hypothetical protein